VDSDCLGQIASEKMKNYKTPGRSINKIPAKWIQPEVKHYGLRWTKDSFYLEYGIATAVEGIYYYTCL
jgi:hypothetical protein